MRVGEQVQVRQQTKTSIAKAALAQLRIKQWTKNLLVLASAIFSGQFFVGETAVSAILAFFCFSFVASSVYIVNDILDVEKDRVHPDKRNRPIASGNLPIPFAISMGVVLLCSSITLSLSLSPLLTSTIVFYFVMNILYCFKFKHVVIMDVMIIALGFVLRALAGTIAVNGLLTPWFFLCTLLLSLFLALGKRRHELHIFEGDESKQRKVLKFYSIKFLDQLISIVTGLTIMSYSLYAATAADNYYLMFTIPLVIYGVFRYMYLVHMENSGGKPEEVLLTDKHILSTIIVFGLSVILIRSFL